jgi:DNA (cytosine-5)-methyltransferase 1
MEYTASSMFAGVGGIDFAFQQAGFKMAWANEMDKHAIKTFKVNHPDTVLFEGKIEDYDEADLPYVDVLTGGFPCQSFSLAGLQKGFKDIGRGTLFFEIIRVAKHMMPRAIMLENVKNLVHHDKGNTMRVILEQLDNLGYHVKHQILSGDTHGNIPQGRKRIFIICFKSKKDYNNFEFPAPIPLTVEPKELIDSTAPLKYYYNKTQYFQMLLEEMTDFDAVYQLRRKYVRKNMNGVCPTLTANAGKGGHNVPIIWDSESIRKLTPREMFRFQGFDDSFIFPKGIADCHLYCQAGNSVIIPVDLRIAKRIWDSFSTTDRLSLEEAR